MGIILDPSPFISPASPKFENPKNFSRAPGAAAPPSCSKKDTPSLRADLVVQRPRPRQFQAPRAQASQDGRRCAITLTTAQGHAAAQASAAPRLPQGHQSVIVRPGFDSPAIGEL